MLGAQRANVKITKPKTPNPKASNLTPRRSCSWTSPAPNLPRHHHRPKNLPHRPGTWLRVCTKRVEAQSLQPWAKLQRTLFEMAVSLSISFDSTRKATG